MGILGRINSVIKSNLNAALDKMTDPAKEIELLIVELEENVKKAREEVVSCLADAKRLGMRADELQHDVEQWQRRAEQAVRASDDGLAREALERRGAVATEQESARRAQREQEAYVEELKASLQALEARVRDIKVRKESLKARAKAAKDGRPALSGGKAFDDFNRLEDRIEAMEAVGELSAATDQRDAAVEAKFAQLEAQQGKPEVEDALAALKRKVRGDG